MADRERRRLIAAHQEWLGFAQPVGLVFSPTVLVDAQVVPDRNAAARQRAFTDLLTVDESGAAARWRTPDLRRVLLGWLGWEADDLVDASAHRETLQVGLPELQTVLAPTWAVRVDDVPDLDHTPAATEDPPGAPAADAAEEAPCETWMLLIRVEEPGADLDRPPPGAVWNASRHERFVRLLAETDVPVGLLCSDDRIRIVYAPAGETPGYLTFDFSQMAMPAGRPILAAFDMLLSAPAMFGHPDTRLPTLLARSRAAQAEVSTRLSRQVLAALYSLLRGFVTADAEETARLARESPAQLYNGLIVVLMRLVFLLYTEDRGLMPDHSVHQQHYALGGLFARLRADSAAWPDTMDQRFGAWAQLLVLFRLVHGGGGHGRLRFAARGGRLFDPGRFPFLERLGDGEPAVLPRVPDETVWRILQNLMLLDGERLSYRTLDVEQIGSVYEALMGFRIELTTGRSFALRSGAGSGAAVVVDLDALLVLDGDRRARSVREQAGVDLPPKAAAALRRAATLEDAAAALDGRVDRAATPAVAPPGTPVLQPTDERRRSGSHYTPSTLTGPIVADALAPLFERLGPAPPPDRILDLKVCDPAMGSGAFLVEACRQLSARLVDAWRAHGAPVDRPADVDESLHARRLVARRCLYGVDRNPMAVDLARLSLWLVTLAADHEFTFVDHALRHGDSLVGLTRAQITALHWRTASAASPRGGARAVPAPVQRELVEQRVRERVAEAGRHRARLHAAGQQAPTAELDALLQQSAAALADVRLYGDLVLHAFFSADRPRERERLRTEYAGHVQTDQMARHRDPGATLRRTLGPFHWEIEFPEVFDRERSDDQPAAEPLGRPGAFDREPAAGGGSEAARSGRRTRSRARSKGEFSPAPWRAGGFDAIVGNPPFLGGKRISTVLGAGYRDWLAARHDGASSNADLAAHFFRRAFDLLRPGGAFGLIATNTIAQGDTRGSGLRWICTHGGTIYRARKRVKWPGLAAVVVSVLHVHKAEWRTLPGAVRTAWRIRETATAWGNTPTAPVVSPGGVLAPRLDNEPVEQITAFLFPHGGHDDPARLRTNAGQSFQGSILRGMGFTFDDTDRNGVATPLAEMERLLAENPRNRQVVFPYIGGEEVNRSPTHEHHRYAINFLDWPLRRENLGARWADADDGQRHKWRRQGVVPLDYPGPVAADWPDLLKIVEDRVRPERERLGASAIDRSHKQHWWLYANDRPQLRAAIAGLDRVLAISRHGQHAAFAFLPTGMVYAESTIVFPLGTHAAFCALQSRPHELWTRFLTSSMKDDLRYTPFRCFETFPFPDCWETHRALEAAGRACYEYRAALMVRNHEGLTTTYNRFHDPDDRDPAIAELRALHAAMDRAVLDAYGWTDLSTDCEFLLDHGDEDAGTDASTDEPAPAAGRRGRRRKPYRCRWPDATRDEVLARLLALNADRAAEEARAAGAVTPTDEQPRRPHRPRRPVSRDRRAARPQSHFGETDE